MIDTSRCNCPWWRANNYRYSIDAHCHDSAGIVSLSPLGIKTLNIVIMYSNDWITVELPDLQDQYLLTLCWSSLSRWGRERVALSFAYKASHYLITKWVQPIATQITHDARLKIVDVPLTIILPWKYPQYGIISVGTVYHRWCFGSLSIVFMYIILHHYSVL